MDPYFIIALLFAATPCGLGILMFVWLIASLFNAYTDDTWADWKTPDAIIKIMDDYLPLLGKILDRNTYEDDSSDAFMSSVILFFGGGIASLFWPVIGVILTAYLLLRLIRFARRLKKYVSIAAKLTHRHTKSGQAAKVEIPDFKF